MKQQDRTDWSSNEVPFPPASRRWEPEREGEETSRAYAWALEWDSAALAELRKWTTGNGPRSTDGTHQ